jgi:pyrimidine operon attenuation protein/uracil phosphoribosyltransferase
MSADEMAGTIGRLADAVVATRPAPGDLAIIGIERRGAVLARRLATAIEQRGHERPPVGAVDIALYRDDLTELATYPIVRPTVLPGDIGGRTVILVDDVLFTGRTARAAIGVLIDHGRPRAIRLAVLVDRGHRELPIRADYVGRNLPTSRAERVNVHVVEVDGVDRVTLGRPSEPPALPWASVEDAGPTTD